MSASTPNTLAASSVPPWKILSHPEVPCLRASGEVGLTPPMLMYWSNVGRSTSIPDAVLRSVATSLADTSASRLNNMDQPKFMSPIPGWSNWLGDWLIHSWVSVRAVTDLVSWLGLNWKFSFVPSFSCCNAAFTVPICSSAVLKSESPIIRFSDSNRMYPRWIWLSVTFRSLGNIWNSGFSKVASLLRIDIMKSSVLVQRQMSR